MRSLLCLLLALAVVSALPCIASNGACASAIFSNGASEIVEDPKTLFVRYVQKYEKDYAPSEVSAKFANFKASIERVNKLNRASPNAIFGLTKFSDMAPAEFQTTILMRNPIIPKEPEQPVLPADVDAPDTFDWRPQGAVTPVKNQEQCGSCWAFSATEAVESAYIRAGKATNESINLGPQQIVDCDTTSDGCGGGETESAYSYLIQAGGQESNSSYPYTGQDGTCNFKKDEVVATISSYKSATSGRSETTLQSNLVSWGPLSICVDASSWQDYQSGVLDHFQCAIFNILDHCVQLVGYNATNSPPYWIVRNSWTDTWGIDGYIWLEMWHDTCGLTKDATWPTL